jgi:acyl-CoA reductase-like NAD-dependent aldehyde dehydrogenase
MDCNLTVTNILQIPNWVDGADCRPTTNQWINKFNPSNSALLSEFADSSEVDVDLAISAADRAFIDWSLTTPIKRGQIISDIVLTMKLRIDELVSCVALETGKSIKDATGEVAGAIMQGEFFAGEGMRLYGRSLTSSVPEKQSFTIRQPRGIAGLIVPANTSLANIAWKVFPALICGNSVVLKASEDAPQIAFLFAQITRDSGLPDGVFNVIQGRGHTAGKCLVADSRVAVISFTGSTEVGRSIAEVAGKRLATLSLELGGKNPFIVCDDADLDLAVHWALLSAFSNAGQRCAAGSRILIFKNVYKDFRNRLVSKASELKMGVAPGCDLGPVINKRQQILILEAIQIAKKLGGKVLCGGSAPSDIELRQGYYIQPTIIEGLSETAEICQKELFGPVATLHSVDDLMDALRLANDSEYGLTSAIHTANIDRAIWFARRVRAGVVNVNIGSFGSEPHMPFGGYGNSGNGTREPGVEALDIYSELKNISILVRSNLV